MIPTTPRQPSLETRGPGAGLWALLTASVLLGGLCLGRQAHATPSFARQTGMSCSACHTQFPELTPFGRDFKLRGYTLGSVEKVSEDTADGGKALEIDRTPPLSAMYMASDAFTRNPAPNTTVGPNVDNKGAVSMPQQFSLFYAGEMAPNLGAFIQATYADGSFGMDNTDVRWALPTTLLGQDLILGATLNNNPTVQDVWNSTPAWGFPFFGGASLGASPLMNSWAGNVAGLGVYAYCDGMLYAEFSAYRGVATISASQGIPGFDPTPGATQPTYLLQGAAPYWRLALTKDWGSNSAELGTYGMLQTVYPAYPSSAGLDSTAPTDRYDDVAVDAQYQYIGSAHILTAQASFLREQDIFGSFASSSPLTAGSSGQFNTFKVNGNYLFNRTVGGTVAYQKVVGAADSVLYASSPSNVPNTDALTYELDYLPWRNTKFSLQYVQYLTESGSTSNIDGTGRSAADDNTLLAEAWLVY